MATATTLDKLFLDQIRDLYDAEKQLTKALPKLAKAASSEELADAINEHLEQTRNHVTRLEKVFSTIDTPAKGRPCKAMQGLIAEGAETVADHKNDGVLGDLAMIGAAQKVEHYEVSGYGTARTMAERLNNDEAVQLLQETENEEREADETLTRIAMSLYDSTDEEETENESPKMGAKAETRGRKNTKEVPRRRGSRQ